MIKLVNVCKSFGSQTVLNNLCLEIPKGEITAIIGPSGEGKSILLKQLIGLQRPESGQVIVDGLDITRLGRSGLNRVREKFGMLFQNAALFDSLTVFENVAFPLEEKTRLTREQIRVKVHEALRHVGLGGSTTNIPMNSRGG